MIYMETINTEIVVSSLFNVGFDKVDPALFVFVLAKLSMDDKNQLFSFDDQKASITFDKYVDYDGVVFKLKDGFQIDTNVSHVEGFVLPLGKALITNRYLIKYLQNLDFSEIILKKAEIYGVQSIEDIDESRFSLKEINILKQLNLVHNSIFLNLKR